jgi:hypothetical protein
MMEKKIHMTVERKVETILYWYSLEAKKYHHDTERCALLKMMAKKCITHEEYEMGNALIHKRIEILQDIRRRRQQSDVKYYFRRFLIRIKYQFRIMSRGGCQIPVM